MQLSSSEEAMFCPRFILKIIGVNSTTSNIQLHYTVESLMANVMNMLGSSDMVVQPFIKQKHPSKPSLLQYYMKNNNGVYKACTLVNKLQLDKTSHFYERIIRFLLASYKQVVD